MDDVPLLGSANTYLCPIILFIIILFNVLDIYSKVLKAFGLQQFEFSESFDDDRILIGKKLVKRCKGGGRL